MTTIVAIASILHGLTHLWYVTLSLRLIEVTADMEWTGKSWLLPHFFDEGATRSLALFLYIPAAIGFVTGGAGLLLEQSWFRPFIVSGSAISIVAVLIYWDGVASKLVEKGMIGLLLSIGSFVGVGMLGWPASID